MTDELETKEESLGTGIRSTKSIERRDDDMVELYVNNETHYETGLTRIGCSFEQARAYSALFEAIRSQYRDVVSRVIGVLGPEASVCDVGMGLGHDLEHFCLSHPDVHFCGVELSEETLKIAARRLRESAVSGKVRLSNSSRWYEEEQYDLVVNNCVFEHVADPVAFCADIGRSLKPGGRFVFAVPNHAYWLFWHWPYYALRLPFRGLPRTHSVPNSVMKQAIQNAGLRLDHHVTIGFRPPQPFFAAASPGLTRRLIGHQAALQEVFRTVGLEGLLYINVFVGCAPGAVERRPSASVVDAAAFDSSGPGGAFKLFDILLAAYVYASYPVRLPLSLLRRWLVRRSVPRSDVAGHSPATEQQT